MNKNAIKIVNLVKALMHVNNAFGVLKQILVLKLTQVPAHCYFLVIVNKNQQIFVKYLKHVCLVNLIMDIVLFVKDGFILEIIAADLRQNNNK